MVAFSLRFGGAIHVHPWHAACLPHYTGVHSYLRLSSMHLSDIENCSPRGLFGTLEARKGSSLNGGLEFIGCFVFTKKYFLQ